MTVQKNDVNEKEVLLEPQPFSIDEKILPQAYAAVDLGSNSFHMVISMYQHGEFTVIERLRESVRLASGLDEEGNLSEEVSERALACLQRFGQLLRSLLKQNVRVVGTNALRRLKNKSAFIEQAENALNHPLEIIAGREEARLIYLGVSKWSESGDDKRLVIDIGGGSTEIIIGKGEKPVCRESLEVGCVVLSQRFFVDGVLSAQRFEQAKLAAELAIQPVVKQFRSQGWANVLGCSGTMKSIELLLVSMGLSKEGITYSALQQLLEHVTDIGHLNELELPGLSDERKPVFAGGLSIILALFNLLEIKHMSVSEIALREGVLYDLIGRSSADDVRDVTVSAMLSRWAIEAWRGDEVQNTALVLHDQLSLAWDIHDEQFKSILGWAARLHELGLLISHDRYHKHGAYVVANADMAGFAKRDQLLLAALIYGHRRKFPIEQFESLPAVLVTPAKRLAVILRLAVLLHRDHAHSSNMVEQFTVSAEGRTVSLSFVDGWLDEHPLTHADLSQEQQWLKVIGIKLKFK